MADPAEGLRRLRLLGRRVVAYGGLGGLVLFLSPVLFGAGMLGILELLILVGAPLLIGGILQLIAWIIEGFAQNQTPQL